MKKLLLFFVGFTLVCLGAGIAFYKYVKATLPNIASIQDYSPLLVSSVYDRNGKKIGEFTRERRTLIPYEKIPKRLVNAFLAAEDDQFFEHKGVNYTAILRATLANLRAGRTVQGGSTITQQVAKTFFLSSEKSLLRKAREALLALQLEEKLGKEDILYLYLNQIFFGQGAYGIVQAAETYFRKKVDDLSLGEAAILAGLPKAPSAFTPVRNPSRSKERQAYILRRMAELRMISSEEAENEIQKPLLVHLRQNYDEYAPYFLESVRQILVARLGEEQVLDRGLKIYTSLDLKLQLAAQAAVEAGLKALDKRQGYRGPLGNTTDPKEVGQFLMDSRDRFIQRARPERIIEPNGQFLSFGQLDVQYDLKKLGLPFYLTPEKSFEGIVSQVDDTLGLVTVKVAEIEGLIDFESMQWARKPDAEKRSDQNPIKKASEVLRMGDQILVRLKGDKFQSPRLSKLLAQKKLNKEQLPDFSRLAWLELDQEPLVEGALLSIDQDTQDVLAMVGGLDFAKSKHNKTFQAKRQTGSIYKSIVYASALDKGYTPSTPITDAPLVYEQIKETEEGTETNVWKPDNHGKNFLGDISFRNALVRSLNVPTVKIIEDIKVDWALQYSRRLGIFSPLNEDFTLALGSSSVTLYEITKAFAQFGRMGKRTRPQMIRKVEAADGQRLAEKISLDERLQSEMQENEKAFEVRRENYFSWKKWQENPASPAPTLTDGTPLKKPHPADEFFFFEDPDQLIQPTTAYLITSLLKASVEDKNGTGVRARALGREVAGKTGTTNSYVDAWFIGYTPNIATGVWVGYSQPRSLGVGEVGGRAALPMWLDFMKAAHEGLPQMTFPVPSGIVFANIDADSGGLPTSNTKMILRQAYLEGTEPTSSKNPKEEETDFYKQDLSE